MLARQYLAAGVLCVLSLARLSSAGGQNSIYHFIMWGLQIKDIHENTIDEYKKPDVDYTRRDLANAPEPKPKPKQEPEDEAHKVIRACARSMLKNKPTVGPFDGVVRLSGLSAICVDSARGWNEVRVRDPKFAEMTNEITIVDAQSIEFKSEKAWDFDSEALQVVLDSSM